jgi:hypothetical protein
MMSSSLPYRSTQRRGDAFDVERNGALMVVGFVAKYLHSTLLKRITTDIASCAVMYR